MSRVARRRIGKDLQRPEWPPGVVIGGVDTHKHAHVAAACDALGRVLATAEFATTTAGFKALLRFLRSHGQLAAVGVEGTGCWGGGLARFLTARDVKPPSAPLDTRGASSRVGENRGDELLELRLHSRVHGKQRKLQVRDSTAGAGAATAPADSAFADQGGSRRCARHRGRWSRADRGDDLRLVRWADHSAEPRTDPQVVFAHVSAPSLGTGTCCRLRALGYPGCRAARGGADAGRAHPPGLGVAARELVISWTMGASTTETCRTSGGGWLRSSGPRIEGPMS
jgi:hypothetical protein